MIWPVAVVGRAPVARLAKAPNTPIRNVRRFIQRSCSATFNAPMLPKVLLTTQEWISGVPTRQGQLHPVL